MLFATLWLFTFSTLDLAFGFQFNIIAFFGSRGNAIMHFSDISIWVNVMKMVTYVAQTFMADCIVLYRCWIIYGRNWKIIFVPSLMWIAETVCGAIAASVETTVDNSSVTGSRALAPYIISFTILTLATNLLVTSLMVFRIWSIQTSIRRLMMDGAHTNPTLKNVMLTLIESGAIYTTVVLILLCTYMTDNNAAYLVSDCLNQIIGIVFNLILIKVARGTAVKPMDEAIQTALRDRSYTTNIGIDEPGSRKGTTNIDSVAGDISTSDIWGGS